MMNKITINTRGGYCSLSTAFKWMVCLVTAYLPITFITAQDYIGMGLHLTPPIRFDYTNTTHLKIRPLPGIGGSLTYRRELGFRKQSAWYVQVGLTLQGLRYYQLNYINDSATIWSDYINNHTGFPSLLAGAGRSWNFGRNNNNQISAGGELLFLITQDLDEIGSYNFGIINHPINDAVGPFFIRLNLGYSKGFSLFRLIPAQLQIYTALGLQNITKGTQYVRDLETGRIIEGRYYVNNSELGIKLYSSLNWRAYQKTPKQVSVENAILAQEERQRRFRISLNGQFCRVPRTVYHIPQVDSFSVGSRPIMLPQLGVVVEIPNKRNDLWSTVVGVSVGRRDVTLEFNADGNFPSHNQPVQNEQSLSVGHHVILNVGLARRHSLKGKVISHTLTASAVVPIEQESLYFGVPLTNFSQTPPPFTDAILEGTIIQDNYQERVLFGIEYNPEFMLDLPGPLFMGLGLVANYSFGGVIAGGEFKVSNEHTTYHGAVLQKFGKLGVSMRIGFEK